MKTFDVRADELITVLQLDFVTSDEYQGCRIKTAWGTKTRQGLIAVIKRIMLEDTVLDKQGEALVDVLKEAQSYILKQKNFNIRKADDFHIANVLACAISSVTKEAK